MLSAAPGSTSIAPPSASPTSRRGCSAPGAHDITADAWDTLRIEAGLPLFGVDMDTDTIPLEAGLEARAISQTKGCYVGQEVVIRILHRGGGRVVRRLVAWTADAESTTDAAVPGARHAGRRRRQGHRPRHQRRLVAGAAPADRPRLRAPRSHRAGHEADDRPRPAGRRHRRRAAAGRHARRRASAAARDGRSIHGRRRRGDHRARRPLADGPPPEGHAPRGPVGVPRRQGRSRRDARSLPGARAGRGARRRRHASPACAGRRRTTIPASASSCTSTTARSTASRSRCSGRSCAGSARPSSRACHSRKPTLGWWRC